MSAEMSEGTRNYLARKFFMDELGRVPKPAEQAFRAEQIRTSGVDAVFAALYDSAEAKAHRKRVGRTV